MRTTGWFGRPPTFPRFPGSGTQVHVVEDDKPICKVHLHPDNLYQYCAPGVRWDYIECERCKAIIRREERFNK